MEPVTAEVVECVPWRRSDDPAPRMARRGHDARSMAESMGARTAEVKSLPQGGLEAARAREMTARMMAAGSPV